MGPDDDARSWSDEDTMHWSSDQWREVTGQTAVVGADSTFTPQRTRAAPQQNAAELSEKEKVRLRFHVWRLASRGITP